MNNNLDKSSFLLQAYSLLLIIQDFNNKDLMQELQNQDEKYLKTIIVQNEKIIELLERREKNGQNST